MKNRKGFTIVELVIVIAVIAILAAVLIPTFSGVINNANASSAQQEARTALSNALGMSSNATLSNGTLFVVYNGSTYYYFSYNGNKLEQVDEDDSFLDATKYSSLIMSNKGATPADQVNILAAIKKVFATDTANIASGTKVYTVTYGTDTAPESIDAAFSPDFSTNCVTFVGNGSYTWAEGKLVSTTTTP